MVQKAFQKQDGTFVQHLDKALASFNVYRQAYYSGTFIGNHVLRTLLVRAYLFESMYIVTGPMKMTLMVGVSNFR